MKETGAPPLRVASWPGYGATHNPFVHIFLNGLEAAGCEVISAERVEDIGRQEADILLLHWAERVFAESDGRLAAVARIARLVRTLARRPKSTRVVWLVHNLAPHKSGPINRVVWPLYLRALSRQVDGFMTLSPGTVPTVRHALPELAEKPGVGLWHPAYPDAVLPESQRAGARAALGWTSRNHVFGYCGQIRPYKGVGDLIASFRETTEPDLRLLLAGRPDRTGFADTLRAAAADDPRIVLRLEDLSAEAFREALGICDVVVAPLRSYLHSGSILHALSAGRPVLTPATPFSESLSDALGTEWVRCYPGALSADLLEGDAPLPDGVPNLGEMSADRVAAEAAAFFRTLRAR